MNGPYVLAVDQSTAATKAVLFDTRADPVHRTSIEHAQRYPQPGWVEHDAEEILDNTVRVVMRVLREADVPAAEVAALAITNQRETIVAWDERSGKPVSSALVWQDERGTPVCQELRERGSEPLVKGRTGLVLDTYYSASKLAWLVRNNDRARETLSDRRLMCGTIDAWLVWNLSGRRVFATDYSNACRTLLFDIGRLRWDEELLALFGLTGIRLPAAQPSDGDFGEAELPGLSSRIPIRAIMGDSHAALFGQAGFSPGAAKTTYGTGSSVMMNVGTRLVSPPEGIMSSIGWGTGSEVTYVFEGNIHHTGDTVRWLRDNLGLFQDFEKAERMATGLTDNGGVYLVPAFSGLGAPHWTHGVRALICGLSRASGAAEIVRAAFESIAYQIHDVIAAMTADRRAVLTDLRADGGATVNRFLMQFQADILGVPLHVASIPEVSARGAAFAAGLKAGIWRDGSELARLAVPRDTYTPRMGAEERSRLLKGWNHAVAQVLAH